MEQDLDRLLARLAQEPADRRLDQVEPLVWARVESRTAARAQLGWRAATIGLALSVGAAFSGIGAARSGDELAAFSPHAALAPSTLLEGG